MSGAYTTLILQHIASGREVTLPIRVLQFSQDVSPSFASTEVYGRMDPIYTYQNTKRTFQVNCSTIIHSELPKLAGDAIKTKVKGADKLATYVGDGTSIVYNKSVMSRISSLYKIMYPLYEKEAHVDGSGTPVFDTYQLKGPPILKILIPNVLGGPGSSPAPLPPNATAAQITAHTAATNAPSADASYIFVPEEFSLSTGLANVGEIQMVMTGPDDLKYIAPIGGFGFTLGGTILHADTPPGFVAETSTTGTGATATTTTSYKFTKKAFPFGAKSHWNKKNLLE